MSRSNIHSLDEIKVHFMGIGGSGMSAVALLAHHQGYKVSGCDLLEDTPYLKKLEKLDIPIFVGHSTKHLNDIDILAITPAAEFQSKKHSELVRGEKLKKIMTWQKFLGQYLQKDKKVICIAGTHGKSTTTGMTSLLFEMTGLDPNVMIGATIKKWNSNARAGKSEIFITESDEFFDNFLNYSPDTIVLNNIEMDHPDFFKSEKQLFESFKKHVESLVGSKTLIFNQDCPGIRKLFKSLPSSLLNSFNLIGYTIFDKPIIKANKSFFAKNIVLSKDKTIFEVVGRGIDYSQKYILKLPGKYNVSNALGVIALANLYKIDTSVIRKFFLRYSGIGRRMDLIGDSGGVKVYEDYAHHSTAVKVTLGALRQKYPKSRIWAVIEPHSYSRTKILLKSYSDCFKSADEVIIAPIFRARDKENFGISEQSIVDISNHSSIVGFDNFRKVKKYLKLKLGNNDVVVVMGAGKSYQYAREVYANL